MYQFAEVNSLKANKTPVSPDEVANESVIGPTNEAPKAPAEDSKPQITTTAPSGVTSGSLRPQSTPVSGKARPLTPRYSSHKLFLTKRLKAANRLAKARYQVEKAASIETYPRRFKRYHPNVALYRKQNPRPKRRVAASAPVVLTNSRVHGRHTVQIEGENLVVRETASPKAAPISYLPHGIPLSAGRMHPHQTPPATIAQATLMVVGDRVVLIGGYPTVRSLIIDSSGKLTESRGFSIPSSIVSVSGDEIRFAILPSKPSYSNPSHVPVALPQIQIVESPDRASYVPLIDGARTYGPPNNSQRQQFTPFNLLVVGQCSFSVIDPEKACIASATEDISGLSYISVLKQTPEAVIFNSTNGDYFFPWTGAAPFRLVPDGS